MLFKSNNIDDVIQFVYCGGTNQLIPQDFLNDAILAPKNDCRKSEQ